MSKTRDRFQRSAHRAVLAAVVVVGAWGQTSLAGIEVQTGTMVGERLGNAPKTITADPFFQFDPMGGTRRLDRVTIDVEYDWEVVLQLANPLPEQQIMTYSAIREPFAELETTTRAPVYIGVPLQPYGTIVAEPFQTVQRLESYHEPPYRSGDLDPDDLEFPSLIGPGAITVERFAFETDFDTSRLINGVPSGGPVGYSRERETWSVHLRYTYEFTLVPSPGSMLVLAVLAAPAVRRRARSSQR